MTFKKNSFRQVANKFILITPLIFGSVFANAEITDAEKAADLERQTNEIQLRKELLQKQRSGAAKQNHGSDHKTYVIPQRREDNMRSRVKGNQKLISTDLREEKEEQKNKYHYQGYRHPTSGSSSQVRENRRSGKVVGNTNIHHTKVDRTSYQDRLNKLKVR